MKRVAILLRVTVLGTVITLVVVGGLAVYYFTLPPVSVPASAAPGSSLITNQGPGRYLTVEYNGTSYRVPPKGPNSPSFGCPPGTDPSLCTLLHETCGNGVGPIQEPWKTCYNCVFDAGCSGDNSCDPYTHECSSPASACQIIAGGYNQAG
jgi:hypothetical protein